MHNANLTNKMKDCGQNFRNRLLKIRKHFWKDFSKKTKTAGLVEQNFDNIDKSLRPENQEFLFQKSKVLKQTNNFQKSLSQSFSRDTKNAILGTLTEN